MKKYILIIIFLGFKISLCAQHIFKPVIEIDYSTPINTNDTNVLYIKRIDTSIFRKLISNGNKMAIQLWQPWCSGILDVIPEVIKLKERLKGKGYQFLFISDRREGLDYLKITERKVGKVVYFFNKYNLQFESYQVTKGEELDDYKRIISDVTKKVVNYNYFCFLLHNGMLSNQNNTSRFYKRMLK